jgi:type IX secretion system PorP/SprF family membrane protein
MIRIFTNNIYRIALLLVAIIATAPQASAQDFHLSQYDAAPLYLNPAMTGMFNGHYRIHGHYRTQWSSIASKPFQTSAISYDMAIKKWAFGAQIMNNRAGAGNFNVFSFAGSGAYDISLDEEGNNHFSFGLQAGLIHKSVDISRLVFNNQYSNANGGGFDNSISSGENFGTGESTVMPDLNAGFIYYYGNESSRLNPFLGASVFHLTQPKETFFSNDNRLPMRIVVHGGTRININEKIQLQPKALYMKQSNAQELTTSLIVQYYLEGSDAYILFGPTWRKKDAAIIEAGLKYDKYVCKISYDINTSTLNPTTNGRGGFEISLSYIPKKQKPNPIPTCPRL